MRKIAIIDDEEKVISQLKVYLNIYQKDTEEEFQIYDFSDGEQFLTNYKPVYDIVFMDIELPYINGLEVSRRLRKLDENVVLIFITNLARYAIQGYEVAATDFIVKPVNYTKFAQKLGRALTMIPRKQGEFIVLNTKTGLVKLSQDVITYVEIYGHSLCYHTQKEKYEVRGTLKSAQDTLDNDKFFVCNKCYLVNLDYVEKIEGYSVIVAGDEITVSRPKKKALMEALASYR